MYKLIKTTLLILYPLLCLVLPMLLVGSIGSGGANEQLNVFLSLFSRSLPPPLLLLVAIIFLYLTYKKEVFKKTTDRKRAASVSDYFATAFAFLLIIQFLYIIIVRFLN